MKRQVYDLFYILSVPRVVEFLTELHNTTVLEGEDATFKCVVSPEDVQLVWLMDNEAIIMGDRFQAHQNGLCHTLVIKKCQMLDCSKITAEAEGQISKASLKVQGKTTERKKKLLDCVAKTHRTSSHICLSSCFQRLRSCSLRKWRL